MRTKHSLPGRTASGRTDTAPCVLILTAPVGAGHDAAARALAAQLEASGCRTRIENSLRRVGPWAEWVVVSGYRAQLRYAPWTYDALYAGIVRVPGLARFLKWLCGMAGSRHIRALLDEMRPDVVVTTYHLASAMLARLRRKGRLPIPAAAMITDLAPHPMWVYPSLDAHLVLHPRTAAAVASATKGRAVVVRPPVDARFEGRSERHAARRELGVSDEDRVAVVTGGSWGVGSLDSTVQTCARAGWRPAVVCGHNEGLRARLDATAPSGAIVLGFVEDMARLLDAADAVIVNGPGLTCLESFARGVPVLVYHPIPGHGRDNAVYMAECGLVRYARSAWELGAELTSLASADVELETSRARGLFDGPAAAQVLLDTAPRLHAPRRRRAVAAVALVGIAAAWTAGSSTGVAAATRALRHPVVQSGRRIPEVALCIRVGRDAARARGALEILRRANARATFFMSGRAALRAPADVRAIAESGNEVGNGGERALGGSLAPWAAGAERRGASDIEEATGEWPRYFLPASGRLWVGQALSSGDERAVIAQRGPAVRAGGGLRPGEVVVVDLWRPGGLDVLSGVLERAGRDGLKVGSLSDFLAAGGGRGHERVNPRGAR